MLPYRLCDIVDYYRAVCVSVVHGRQRLVALLPCCVPNLKLDRCLLIEGNRLCQECGADGGFSVVVELILYRGQIVLVLIWLSVPSAYLDKAQNQRTLSHSRFSYNMSADMNHYSTHISGLHEPKSTSLNCANRAPPGRPPCWVLAAMIAGRCGAGCAGFAVVVVSVNMRYIRGKGAEFVVLERNR